MSFTLVFGYSGGSGSNLYARIRRVSDAQLWKGTTSFEAFNASNWTSYAVAMTEEGASGVFKVAISTLPDGVYSWDVYERLGGSAAISDTLLGEVGAFQILAGVERRTVVLESDGLDAIPTSDPAGVASTFPKMMVQVWRRFFKKATLTATQMKTYADDGTTVRTTQVVGDDGTTQSQGVAS